MKGTTFHWLMVFEMVIGMPVEDSETPQLVNQKWSRQGDIVILTGQATSEIIDKIQNECKANTGVPQAALLTNIVFNPMFLAGR